MSLYPPNPWVKWHKSVQTKIVDAQCKLLLAVKQIVCIKIFYLVHDERLRRCVAVREYVQELVKVLIDHHTVHNERENRPRCTLEMFIALECVLHRTAELVQLEEVAGQAVTAYFFFCAFLFWHLNYK